ncbi:hypothetical protein SPSINT_1699 [Staphylococcus pseudintermedius HKU10-03]|nr:hypothetical protein SPSINT_1699 [Staphylococcus pseudintermedius HKU10-03]ADX76111.1 hypothetical protein SPSE_0796 [Staphylococcus pseudintermedius ED99]
MRKLLIFMLNCLKIYGKILKNNQSQQLGMINEQLGKK